MLRGPRSSGRDFRDRTEAGWQWSLERWQHGQAHVFTEEHLLSYTSAGMALQSLTAHLKRIWTTSRFRNVDGSEDSLELWHLPAEKCRAMDAVFTVARDENSWFWTAGQDEFIQRVGRLASLRGRAPAQLPEISPAHRS